MPPPLLGLNTVAPQNQLRPDEAYELTNLIPDTGALRLREGSALSADAGSTIRRLFIWSDGESQVPIWLKDKSGGYSIETVDGSANGDSYNFGFGDVDLTYINTNVRSTMMNNILVLVGGRQAPKLFTGTVFEPVSLSNGITGPTFAQQATFAGVKTFKSRLYYWGNDLGFWYGAVNAIGGTLTWFPLNTVSQRGGRVVSINNWTLDGGIGPDDYFVITMNTGEVLVYQGSNPSDPNDWAIVGRYRISAPLSTDAFLELDGKIHVLTESDWEVLPDKFIRQTKQSGVANSLKQNIVNHRALGGYRLDYDPVRQRILATIPTGDGTYDQLVKTRLGYCRFTGMDANAFLSYGGETYFSSGQYLYNIGGAYGDFGGVSLTDITFSAKTGYSYLGSNNEKRVAMFRPNVRSAGTITVTVALAFDGSNVYPNPQTLTMTAAGTPWGSPWGSEWDASSQQRGEWFVGQGTGQTVSMSLSGSAKAGMEWMSTDFELIPGGLY